MNAARLLGHYEQIADAPDAIARLRRFILDLAVRGKLVEQDPVDEPASELLKRIAAEKARLVKAGKIKKSKSKQADRFNTLFELPKSWKWATLCDLFLYDAGVKRQPKNLNQKLWLLELEDIEKDSGRLRVRITASERESKSTKSEFRVGDILYGKLRPYLNKVLVADRPGYSTTEIVALRPLLRLCPQYCALVLRRPDFVDYVTRLGQGTKMPRLRTEDAVVAPFPLPPLAEQHRIVAKVDELMALCDRLEAARTEREATRDRMSAASLIRLNDPDPDPVVFRNHAAFALENLAPLTTRTDQIKALRQTILNLAVRGKLVKQDPNDEPAAELLKRIAAEKVGLIKTREIRKKEALPSIEQADEPFPIPPSWVWSYLGNLFHLVTDGAHHTPRYIDRGISFLSVKDVSSGTINFTNARQISEDQHTELCKRCCPQKGDILLTKVGTTGIAVPVKTERPFSIFVSVALLKFSTVELSQDYLCHLINSPFVRQQSKDNTQGIGNQNLVLRLINGFALPIPPLAEQRRIVAKVDELIALCGQLEARLNTGDATRNRLLDALLHETLDPISGARENTPMILEKA